TPREARGWTNDWRINRLETSQFRGIAADQALPAWSKNRETGRKVSSGWWLRSRATLARPRQCRRRSRGTRCSATYGSGRNGSRRSEEHTSELQSLTNLVCRLLLEKKKKHLYTGHDAYTLT